MWMTRACSTTLCRCARTLPQTLSIRLGFCPHGSHAWLGSLPWQALQAPQEPSGEITPVRSWSSDAQTVQRQTLRQLMPDTAAVLRNLTKTLQIQEPAFKEVVILYRCLAALLNVS